MRPHEAAAAWIRGHLARQRITKSQAATLVGIPQQTFSRKANGETPFTLDELHLMAEPLGYDVREMLAEVESMWRRSRDSEKPPAQ